MKNNNTVEKTICLVFMFLVYLSILTGIEQKKSNAQTNDVSLPLSNCVICAQFIPNCGPNEVLVPQSCTKCAHCKNINGTEPNNDRKPCNLCGKRCCKQNETCKTIDRCKGKTNCTKPPLKKCAKKK